MELKQNYQNIYTFHEIIDTKGNAQKDSEIIKPPIEIHEIKEIRNNNLYKLQNKYSSQTYNYHLKKNVRKSKEEIEILLEGEPSSKKAFNSHTLNTRNNINQKYKTMNLCPDCKQKYKYKNLCYECRQQEKRSHKLCDECKQEEKCKNNLQQVLCDECRQDELNNYEKDNKYQYNNKYNNRNGYYNIGHVNAPFLSDNEAGQKLNENDKKVLISSILSYLKKDKKLDDNIKITFKILNENDKKRIIEEVKKKIDHKEEENKLNCFISMIE